MTNSDSSLSDQPEHTSVLATPGDLPALPEQVRSTRRRFLGYMAGGAATLAGGAIAMNQSADGSSPLPGSPASTQSASGSDLRSGTTQTGTGPLATTAPMTVNPPMGGRTLVVVELSGGNDGLATLLPWSSGRLHDLRPQLMPDMEELVMIDDQYAFSPGLALAAEQGLAVLQGVGTTDPSGSHFEMERRWWYGQPSGVGTEQTGFFGRMCDELDVGAPVTGLTLGGGPSPSLYATKAATMALRDPELGWFLGDGDDKWLRNFGAGLSAMAAPGGSPAADGDLTREARQGISSALELADVLRTIEFGDTDDELYPYSELREEFATAAAIIDANVGVRMIHVQLGGFDTHEGQRGSHNYRMEQLSQSLTSFRNDLAERGLSESTLIATVSEFGRRPEQNGSGTDHGAASCALLAGPVNDGLHGEAPSLTKLDDDDNLRTTVGMEDYYATLASWFGIDPATVLDVPAKPINGILAA